MFNSKYFISLCISLILGVAIWFAFFAKQAAPEFSQYPAGAERKAAFFNYFQPIVSEVNQEIVADRNQIKQACDTDSASTSELDDFVEKYRIDETDLEQESVCDILLRRADIVPVSLALAQAANESAWGTSRFAQQGNNFFGQWCFSKGCGIVPNSRDRNKTHEVADFRSPSDSVESYMLNLNGHDAYKSLRNIRQSLREKDQTVTGIALSHGLDKYSERGEEYGKELREMITFNQLTRFDLAPE